MNKRRNKGEGSISKLPNGRYKVVITIGVSLDGKQKRKTKTVKTKVEAVETLRELERIYKNPQALKKEIAGSELFEHFYKRFLVKKKITVSKSTFRNYIKGGMPAIIANFEGMKIKDITTPMIDEVIIALHNRGLKPSAINSYRNKLGTIFNAAHLEHIIPENPVRYAIRIPEVISKNDLDLPSPEAVESLLRFVKEKDYTMYTLLVLELATGLRRGEIVGLRWSLVDIDNNLIHIQTQATKWERIATLKTPASCRTLNVAPKVIELLKTIKREDDEFVFPYPNVDRFSDCVKKYFRAVGFEEHITFHDLRHYHATQLILKGAKITAVSKRLGHSKVSTTMNIYVHYIKSMDVESSILVGSEYVL